MLKNKTLLCIFYSTCPTVDVNTFHASLTEEYPQWDVITSEVGTCVFQYPFISLISHHVKNHILLLNWI